MKQFLTIIAVLLIVASLIVAMVACGGDDKANSEESGKTNETNNGNSNATSPDNDKKLLEDNGYTVYTISSAALMYTYSSSINANDGDVVSVTTATKSETEATIYIYYFKDASSAEACYNANWSENSTYHLSGNRIIYDNSQDNLFNYSNGNGGSNSGENNGDNGTSAGMTPKQYADSLYASDEALLKANGYTIYDYSYNCGVEASTFGASYNDLVRYMFAYDNDNNRVRIFYFVSASIASAGAEYVMNDSENEYTYKAVGIRIVRDDPNNMIHD